MLRLFGKFLHSSNILCFCCFFVFKCLGLNTCFPSAWNLLPSSLIIPTCDKFWFQPWHRCHQFVESSFQGSRLGQVPFLCISIEPRGSSIITFFAHCYASLLPLLVLKNTEGKKKNLTAKLFTIVFLITNVLPTIKRVINKSLLSVKRRKEVQMDRINDFLAEIFVLDLQRWWNFITSGDVTLDSGNKSDWQNTDR